MRMPDEVMKEEKKELWSTMAVGGRVIPGIYHNLGKCTYMGTVTR